MTCNKVIIIDSGRIRADDTPQNLVSRMRAAGRVSVEIHADPETAAGAISRLDHVKKVTIEVSADPWTHLSVLVDSGTDARERIAEVASQNGWPLRTLYRHEAKLEDVFVELTRKD
jgi:ABC-2 type transport system ATP-binding protein